MPNAVRAVRARVRHHLHPSRGARRHLAPGLTLEDFFDALREHGTHYTVLRWFTDLPHVDPGEDVDLLVADEDLPFVHSLMADRPPLRGTQKFDVYSVGGVPGSDFGGVPYYPPRFARQVLEHAVELRGRYRVPDVQHHFESLAYHAVYHKGRASGLPDGLDGSAPQTGSDHDYASVLGGLAAQLGVAVAPTLDALDLHLHGRGLRPPLDTIERLEPRNPWLHERFLADQPEVDEVWDGLAVFVLRERAEPLVALAVEELDRQGFEVLDVIPVDADRREAVAHHLRGGNWERGPWPTSGGVPSTYLVAYDVAPQTGGSTGPRAVNLRIAQAKEQLRGRLLADVPAAQRYNPVHSSDNPGQALDYLDALGGPRLAERVRDLAEELVEACTFPHPVLRNLPAQARRARVAVVDHPVHGPSVCKVFRPGAHRFFEREMTARTAFGALPEVPALLEAGDRWLLMPLYTDDEHHVRRYLPGGADAQLQDWAVRALVRLALDLHEQGWFLLDLSTQNVVHDPVHGLTVLDYEFLQQYTGEAPDAAHSYTLRGVPEQATGYDAPQRTRLTGGVGNPAFHPAVTGSSVDDLLRTGGRAAGLRRAAVRSWWVLAVGGRRAYVRARTRAGASAQVRRVRALSRLLARS